MCKKLYQCFWNCKTQIGLSLDGLSFKVLFFFFYLIINLKFLMIFVYLRLRVSKGHLWNRAAFCKMINEKYIYDLKWKSTRHWSQKLHWVPYINNWLGQIFESLFFHTSFPACKYTIASKVKIYTLINVYIHSGRKNNKSVIILNVNFLFLYTIHCRFYLHDVLCCVQFRQRFRFFKIIYTHICL